MFWKWLEVSVLSFGCAAIAHFLFGAVSKCFYGYTDPIQQAQIAMFACGYAVAFLVKEK